MPSTLTLAARAARSNAQRNLAALAARGDSLFELPQLDDVEFVLGRDGAISAIDQYGRFHRGCSVPLLAARAQLKNMTVTGHCGCLLDPMHAATLQVSLDRLRPEQAVIAIVPDPHDAALLLHCADFSADIAAGRCWIVAGDNWPAQMRHLFERNIGLAIPTQFIRTSDAHADRTDPLIEQSQRIFSAVTADRNRRMSELQVTSSPANARRICLVGGQRFRTWNDAGFALRRALSAEGAEIIEFDSDSPLSASHLALAAATRDCDAIVAADLFRSDAAGAANNRVPWITWLTRPRLIEFDPRHPADGVIVADASFGQIAARAGWPKSRIEVGAWPSVRLPKPPTGALPALIADVAPLTPPADLEDLSSHRLLWEYIADLVSRDPFVAFDRAESVLSEAMRKLAVADGALPKHRFIEQLIIPAYALAIARLLTSRGAAFTIHGRGWECFDDLAARSHGPVNTRAELDAIVASASAIIHAVPSSAVHPIDFAGRPVVRYRGGSEAGMLARFATPEAVAAGEALALDQVKRLCFQHPLATHVH